jgi:hypothetical protein
MLRNTLLSHKGRPSTRKTRHVPLNDEATSVLTLPTNGAKPSPLNDRPLLALTLRLPLGQTSGGARTLDLGIMRAVVRSIDH